VSIYLLGIGVSRIFQNIQPYFSSFSPMDSRLGYAILQGFVFQADGKGKRVILGEVQWGECLCNRDEAKRYANNGRS
jgi:hypothetical protein